MGKCAINMYLCCISTLVYMFVYSQVQEINFLLHTHTQYLLQVKIWWQSGINAKQLVFLAHSSEFRSLCWNLANNLLKSTAINKKNLSVPKKKKRSTNYPIIKTSAAVAFNNGRYYKNSYKQITLIANYSFCCSIIKGHLHLHFAYLCSLVDYEMSNQFLLWT